MEQESPISHFVDGLIKINSFLSTRRNEETKKYTKLVLTTLEEDGGWVNVRDLLNKIVPTQIPNESTFFRIIKDLYGNKIIDRCEDAKVVRRGKAPVYYKLLFKLPWSHDNLETYPITHSSAELAAAKELLKEYNCKDPDAAIQEKVRQMFERTIPLGPEDTVTIHPIVDK